MVMVAKSASKPALRDSAASPSHKQRFKGVRMRSWGKWVSEIRLPNTRARLWLGSYATAEQAAHAFDVAVVCLRGRSAALNFPNSPPSYAPLGLPHHQIQELAAAAAAAAAASSPVPTPTATSNSDESETATINYDQSDTATISYSSRSDESEVARTNEMSSSSSSCSSTFDDSATFAGLLELEEENEQSSPLYAALQEHALNMGSEWDERLWGLSYTVAWDEHLMLLPPLPAEDDLPTIVEPSLWSL